MDKKKINLDRDTYKTERPYYIIADNVNSQMKITKLNNFESIKNLNSSKEVKTAIIKNNYFDNAYVTKIKKDAIKRFY
jgi:hypothetical protein